ncbi:unnamed protein product (macronuclear) [Paramecium tetraurelia]|uniref:Uncharacterized protein n=1 Tax=Paramecium tetraurelia TaxID=5888 RepID=A0CFY6_PARTE|nr:uncharacterized protein GSPATT00038145001 [Paramecium tetraurelia]CAK69703.1 unnamed protein product [Paramecium tetraurelia]|eukprot:XP_001437100.1 hypothetical protein (macronuclear) [Paramecium tetraurelia strain d4-2]
MKIYQIINLIIKQNNKQTKYGNKNSIRTKIITEINVYFNQKQQINNKRRQILFILYKRKILIEIKTPNAFNVKNVAGNVGKNYAKVFSYASSLQLYLQLWQFGLQRIYQRDMIININELYFSIKIIWFLTQFCQ